MRQLCPTCTMLSNLVPSPMDVTPSAARSTQEIGNGKLKLSDALLAARRARTELQGDRAYGDATNTTTFASRVSERYAAWRDPLNYGQGKNIDEFMRVLYRADRGDEAGGYL